MRRRKPRQLASAATLLAGLLATSVGAQATEVQDTVAPVDGESLRVWLLTAGPGGEVWERYGHNALRVLDTATGRDVAYNWGIFDFEQVDFIPRFLQGRMLYRMEAYPTSAMIEAYRRTDREVVQQELNLTAAQKALLRQLADENAKPENASYIYQYFLNNCSTQVRDLLDRVLGGTLRARFEGVESGTSFRDNTRRYTQVDPLVYTGMDLALGAPTDEAISMWELMFLPPVLRDEVRDISVRTPSGADAPLVLAEDTLVASASFPEPSQAPRWFFFYLVVGLAVGLALAARASERVHRSRGLRAATTTLGVAWYLLGGVLGLILVGLLFTDHTFAHWNENLFLFQPISLVAAAIILLGGLQPRWKRLAGLAAVGVAGIACVGVIVQLLPVAEHANAMFFALAVPAHIGGAIGFSHRST